MSHDPWDACGLLNGGFGGLAMPAIPWMKDVDAAMADAQTRKVPLLLDFNAAPM